MFVFMQDGEFILDLFNEEDWRFEHDISFLVNLDHQFMQTLLINNLHWK